MIFLNSKHLLLLLIFTSTVFPTGIYSADNPNNSWFSRWFPKTSNGINKLKLSRTRDTLYSNPSNLEDNLTVLIKEPANPFATQNAQDLMPISEEYKSLLKADEDARKLSENLRLPEINALKERLNSSGVIDYVQSNYGLLHPQNNSKLTSPYSIKKAFEDYNRDNNINITIPTLSDLVLAENIRILFNTGAHNSNNVYRSLLNNLRDFLLNDEQKRQYYEKYRDIVGDIVARAIKIEAQESQRIASKTAGELFRGNNPVFPEQDKNTKISNIGRDVRELKRLQERDKIIRANRYKDIAEKFFDNTPDTV